MKAGPRSPIDGMAHAEVFGQHGLHARSAARFRSPRSAFTGAHKRLGAGESRLALHGGYRLIGRQLDGDF